MKKLSVNFQKLLVWLTGYLNLIAFIICGGYLFLNTKEKSVKRSAKTVLYLLAGFTGLDILRSLVYNLCSLFDARITVLSTISEIGTALVVIKALVFLTLFILDMCGVQLSFIKVNDKEKEKDHDDDDDDDDDHHDEDDD